VNYYLAKSNIFIEGESNYELMNIQKNASDDKYITDATVVTIADSHL
jgi:hypothetical protein